MSSRRKPTSTSSFGVSRRESHDSSEFYARFRVPELSPDEAVDTTADMDRIYCKDARSMEELAPSSVALVVTSPPYFAGKEYEQALGEGHVPADYLHYLEMLTEVFAECVRKLEPGGRIAVNVANLGRKPYRSLAADVIAILQDDLKLLLRGEIVWQKAHGASGSTAWGSFQSAANPVLRDLTERVIVASKGRFDRALSRTVRATRGLPNERTIFKDEFMEATTDLWDIPTESATRVGHPAPFPVELPQRLIELYTYKEDLVVDPFMGSGSTAVAAIRTGRHYVGYDTDPSYVAVAEARAENERRAREQPTGRQRRIVLATRPDPATGDMDPMARAVSEGQRAKEIARIVIQECGFIDIVEDRRFGSGVEVNFVAHDREGRSWFFDVSGAFTSPRAGLRRTDTLWKALGKAAVLKASGAGPHRLVLLTTDLPPRGGTGDAALRSTRGEVFHDAVEMLSAAGQERLEAYAAGDGWESPLGDLLPPDEPDDL